MARTKKATHTLRYATENKEVSGYDVVGAPGLFVHKMLLCWAGFAEAKPVRWHVSHVGSGRNLFGTGYAGFNKKDEALAACEEAASLADWTLDEEEIQAKYPNLKEELREQELARSAKSDRDES